MSDLASDIHKLYSMRDPSLSTAEVINILFALLARIEALESK